MSVWRLGNEVSVRPLSTSASTSVHGAWQIAAIGFACSTNAADELDRVLVPRRKSGLATPPGSSRPS